MSRDTDFRPGQLSWSGSSGHQMGLKIYWNATEAVTSGVITSFGIFGVYRLMPEAYTFVFAIAWLLIFAIIYQVGCEYSERARLRKLRRKE